MSLGLCDYNSLLGLSITSTPGFSRLEEDYNWTHNLSILLFVNKFMCMKKCGINKKEKIKICNKNIWQKTFTQKGTPKVTKVGH